LILIHILDKGITVVRLCPLKTLYAASLLSVGVHASTWVPISVGDITTFVPLPSIEALETGNFSAGSTVSIQVGSSQSTQAYYYRQNDSYGQTGAWQCQTAAEVAGNGDALAIEGVSGGAYSYQISACMTGSGCDVSAFESGTLACSETATTASIEVLDNSGTQTPSVSSNKQENVGTTAAQFRVDESGAATYSVPIALPGGTAGVQPQVSLSYSSQGGDGYMGRGWNVSGVGAISRCPKTYVHDGMIDGVKFAKTDRLCLNGQRLILDGKSDDKTTSDVTYWASAARYHTEIDAYTYVKPHYSEAVLKGFTVQNKAGEVHYYGSTTGVSGNSLAGKALAVSFKTRPIVNEAGDSVSSVDRGEDAFVQGATNSSVAKMWALKAIKDIKNNYILYRYIEFTSLGEHFIDEIQYTGNSSLDKSPYAWVKFHYDENKKHKSGWQSGQPVSMTKLLSKVDVRIDNAQHREYRLGYYTSDFLEEKNYLESLTECVDNLCLKPLTFEWRKKPEITTSTTEVCYGADDYGDDNNYDSDDEFCVDRISTDPFKPFTTSTSKATTTANPYTAKVFDISGDGYADIVYVQSGAWKVKLGPNFGTTKTLYSGKADKPEHALILDYNGDGVQDLMVANKTSDKWTLLSYKSTSVAACSAYRPDECFGVRQVNFTNTTVPATGLVGKTQILDVDGDALVDIVMTSGQSLVYYRNNGNGTFAGASTIISLPSDTTTNRFDQGAMSKTANLKNGAALDVNGDGRSDILFQEKKVTGTCSIGGSAVSGRHECEGDLLGTWSSQTSYAWKLYVSTGGTNYVYQQTVSTSSSFEPRIVDLNGDGLTDVMWRSGNNWYYKLSNGLQFMGTKAAFKNGTTTRLSTVTASHDYAIFSDVSADGRTDVLLPNSSVTNWTSYFSRPLPGTPDEVIFESRGTYAFNKNRSIQFGDVNGDGKIDFLQADGSGWYVHKGGLIAQAEDVIDTFDNGFGVKTRLSYGNITDANVYYAKDSTNRFDSAGNALTDYFSPKSGYFAVKTASTDTGVGSANGVKYQYGGLLIHKNGRGMLGFERVRTMDLQTCTTNQQPIYVYDPELRRNILEGYQGVLDDTSCMTTETVYAQHFPYTGMPLQTRQTLGVDGVLISNAENTLAKLTTASKAVYPYIKSSTETANTLSSNLASASALSTTVSTFTYDTYANLTDTLITEKDAAAPSANYRTTKTKNTFGSSTQYKQLGRLTNTTVEKRLYAGGTLVGNNVINRRSSFTYDSNLMLKTETIEPSIGSVKLVTTHGYDGYGNKTSGSTVGAAGENGTLGQTRSSSSAYDSRGRFALSSSNVLGHKSEVEYLGNKGWGKGLIYQVISTDANGITKTVELDVFGQATSSTITGEGTNDPSLVSQTYRAYCSTSGVTCANSSAYIRIIEVAAGTPEKQTYLDKWGRTVETRAQGFDDQLGASSWTVSTQSYDSNGMPARASEPGTNNASSYFTGIQYDRLRRVIKETKPLGSVTRSYSGATTTTVGETGLIHKDTRNYLGQTSQVISANAAGAQQTKLMYSYSANDELLTAKVYAGNTFSHTQVTNQYDDYGRKTSMTDLDKGTWSYKFSAFGQMVKQTNSSNQSTYITYDTLGRKTNSKDNAGYTDWQFDNHADGNVKAKGKLNRVRYYAGKTSASGIPNYQEDYVYASHGKVLSTSILIDGEAFGIEQGYDQFNRPHFTTYPANNFTIKQSYTSLGYPKAITNATQGHREYGVAYETINDINARGQVTSKTLGNEVVETSVYEAKTGWLSSLDVAKGSTLHHALDYTYYNNGNLKTRTNDFAYSGSAKDFKDTFTYDGLNRLNKMTKTGGISSEENYRYDARGNFTYKQGTGYYKYDGSKKNRLSQIWTGSGFTGSKTHTFGYDNRGNVTSDGTRTFDYTAFDKPYLITKGSTKTEFSYGPGRGLYHQRLTVGGKVTDTLYVKGLYERAKLSTGVTEHKYHVGNVVITDRSNNANDTLYLHKDNLGSTVSITDSAGAIKQHLSYDAWGKQSAFNGHSSLTAYTSPATSQGYTGHKMMNDVGIIHMGGRIYDPTLGRFLQADPFIQAPKNSQSYNRYAYVLNNPMSYTDPSGFLFSGLKKFVKKYWKIAVAAAVTYFTAGAASGWVSTWGATWGTAATAATATTAATAAALTASGAVVTGALAGAAGGFIGGALIKGNLKGALRGAFTGALAGAAGGYANFGDVAGWGDAAGRIGVSALGGCAAGKASGGSCRKGASTAAMVQALTMGASELYKRVSTKTSKQTKKSYNEDGKPHFSQRGQSDVGSQLDPRAFEDWQNGILKPEDIGMAYDKSSFMQWAGKGPYMDAFAEFHDGLHDYFFIPDDQVSLILTMPPSYAVTILAAAQPYSSYYHLRLNNRGEY
jgi:RHS repeat-associated protein